VSMVTLQSESPDMMLKVIEAVTREALSRLGTKDGNGRQKEFQARLGISTRHMHLCREDLDKLFGEGYELKVFKELYQKGYFAAQEKVLVVGKRRCLEDVRVLGPLRLKSQVELSKTDAIALGLELGVAESGIDPVSQPIMLVGPKGMVYLPGGEGGGAYIARRHLHMDVKEATALGLKSGDFVDARTNGDRSITFHKILVRTFPNWQTEVHLDTDEGNAAGLRTGDMLTVILP
jgi:putative phosphotransacetylase